MRSLPSRVLLRGGAVACSATSRASAMLVEDGHVASILPGHPSATQTHPVAAVHDSPKPPPVRLTLTLPALNSTDEICVYAVEADKAEAVGKALAPGAVPVPAAEVHGVQTTHWLLTDAAATHAPVRPSS